MPETVKHSYSQRAPKKQNVKPEREKKLCPLRFMIPHPMKADCIGPQCAWFDRECHQCAVNRYGDLNNVFNVDDLELEDF